MALVWMAAGVSTTIEQVAPFHVPRLMPMGIVEGSSVFRVAVTLPPLAAETMKGYTVAPFVESIPANVSVTVGGAGVVGMSPLSQALAARAAANRNTDARGNETRINSPWCWRCEQSARS